MNPLMLQQKRKYKFFAHRPKLMINFSSSNIYVVETFLGWGENKFAVAIKVDRKNSENDERLSKTNFSNIVRKFLSRSKG